MNIQSLNKIIVLGAGGTGSIFLTVLPRFLKSLPDFNGQLIIVDGDSYSESNAERQIFASRFVGTNKAEYQASVIISHFPEFSENVSFVDKYLGQSEINELITENTIVINCVDNIAARKYVEDRVLELKNGAHICCGNELRNGQVQAHVRQNGESITPSIYERYPQLNDVNDDRSAMSCEDLAALPGGGQLVAANMMAAALALNYLNMIVGGCSVHQDGQYIPCDEVKYDVYFNAFARIGER